MRNLYFDVITYIHNMPGLVLTVEEAYLVWALLNDSIGDDPIELAFDRKLRDFLHINGHSEIAVF